MFSEGLFWATLAPLYWFFTLQVPNPPSTWKFSLKFFKHFYKCSLGEFGSTYRLPNSHDPSVWKCYKKVRRSYYLIAARNLRRMTTLLLWTTETSITVCRKHIIISIPSKRSLCLSFLSPLHPPHKGEVLLPSQPQGSVCTHQTSENVGSCQTSSVYKPTEHKKISILSHSRPRASCPS